VMAVLEAVCDLISDCSRAKANICVVYPRSSS